ncbi:uncharacterized protein LOC107795080 isoform X1 [Nicotiana tabacum]|uniref:E3 ubiquitin-protein ligase FANCL n=2 Tax=Nicotiana tabacum TaxID=4097 RepID=A0A1S4A979_TOBAC|nr:PREDICTED: E3 ubiquitin-protein ligase FANCL-like [Nicotiana tabacum]XP_016473134.1 PREDICTED: E3 ubiquitin-protein ligase FANCL-like [Nicotiana tabacum]XP_016473135.1 PREDICTED: E3 ubiquitin-protein ligase FANCL-like [Nicotiana tabacum]XP_016473136.1 PREDICTED: E3 ubiquitin-protein ligase FANCL-like [Nicotiana tabacum]XP_016473137.1 PREDICTED: E3 ubiquitin-protein ligase FANCL-like [Nicotiana tabacum]
MEYVDQNRCRQLAKSSSFYRRIYSEVEEIGWEHLVRLGEDLRLLSFRMMDKNGRVHIVQITLDGIYPNQPPSISADVPYLFNVEWSINSRLKDVIQQFQQHMDKLQEFWSTMDDIDHSLLVSDLRYPHRALSHRQLNISNDCHIMLCIDANDPTSLPDCRFLGSDSEVERLRATWRRNCKRWMKDKPFSENLENILDVQLHGPSSIQKTDPQTECGICYAQYLPIDDELGAKSGSGTDCTCENNSCSRAFHSVCLGDWLRSITTTRQSFDVLFGNCPYCSDPIAVKINTRK